jgi:hypothetical protein
MITRLRNSLALALLAALLFFSCNQDSIFFDLSSEIEPVDPLIGGSSANIVYIEDPTNVYTVYAASIGSSTVYQYTGGWSKPYSVPGGISQLAATKTHLYAISRNNTLYQVDTGGSKIPGGKLQSVYGAGNMVFVGRGSGADSYSVAAYGDSSTNLADINFLPGSDPISGLLQGAAWDDVDDYFIATTGAGGGVYWIDSSNQVRRLSSGNFMGIIHVENYIIAITNNGMLHYFKHGTLSSTTPYIVDGDSYSLGAPEPYYTGAICSWTSKPSGTDPPELLLLGVRTHSRTHGYREVLLDTTSSGDKGKPTGGAVTPGSGSLSTVVRGNRYQSSIEKHAVYSIFQVPKSSVIFASTTKDGLWSLRNDQWNAEE